MAIGWLAEWQVIVEEQPTVDSMKQQLQKVTQEGSGKDALAPICDTTRKQLLYFIQPSI